MSEPRDRVGVPVPGETVTLVPGEYFEQGELGEVAGRFRVEAVGAPYVQNGGRFVDAKGRFTRTDGGLEEAPRYLSIALGPL